MSGNRILIVADDLTGANDAAIQFVNQGLSALVITDAPLANAGFCTAYNVISINSNSRGMSAGAAYDVVHKTLARFGAGYFVYKKIDSVLRGNSGKELAAVMDALHVPLAVAAPSFPANRSVLEKGRLYSGDTTGAGGIDAVRLFAEGTGRNTHNIPLETVRRGAEAVAECIITRNGWGVQVFVADAVTDEDLEIIYSASAALDRPHVLAGSAGLAAHLARHYVPETASQTSKKKPSGLSPALVVAGTRQGQTAAQIMTLARAFSVPVIPFKVRLIAEGKIDQAIDAAYDGAVQLMRRATALCIIAVDSMFQPAVEDIAEGDDTGAAISEALGLLVKKLAGAFRFPLVLSTGGDTSLSICHQIGISAIEPLAEICPGIPLGRVRGGTCDGRYIVTKSGRFGGPDALVEILNYAGVKQ